MPTWIRSLAIAAVAGTVIGLGLGFLRSTAIPDEIETLDVGAMEPLAEQRVISEKESGMPAYHDMQVSAFAGGMKVQGSPMSTGWFTASDPIEEVQTFYEHRLAEMGAPIQTKRFPNGLGYVSYKDPGTDLMHTATLVPQGESQTMVFISTSSAQDVLAGMEDTKVPSELPHPPGAQNTAVLGSGAQQWVTATVSDQTLPQLFEFYRKRFVERGWTIGQNSVDEKKQNGFLRARKAPLDAQVSLKYDPVGTKMTGTSLFVLLTDHRQPGVPAATAAAN